MNFRDAPKRSDYQDETPSDSSGTSNDMVEALEFMIRKAEILSLPEAEQPSWAKVTFDIEKLSDEEKQELLNDANEFMGITPSDESDTKAESSSSSYERALTEYIQMHLESGREKEMNFKDAPKRSDYQGDSSVGSSSESPTQMELAMENIIELAEASNRPVEEQPLWLTAQFDVEKLTAQEKQELLDDANEIMGISSKDGNDTAK